MGDVVLMDSFSCLIVAAGLALVAGTCGSIKQNLIRQPVDRPRLKSSVIFGALEGLLWRGSLIALVFAARHPLAMVIVALLVVSILTAFRLRYQEEAQSLNRWLRRSTDFDTPIPMLLDSVANGSRSRLAGQAKSCARRLNRGESLPEAVRRSKLPLAADTIAAIMIPPARSVPREESPTLAVGSHSEPDARRIHERAKTDSLVNQQFTYVVVTILLAWIIGWYTRLQMMPTLESMSGEWSIKISRTQSILDVAVYCGHIVAAGLIAWLILIRILRFLPAPIVACVPWFGARAIDRWRSDVLATLARGMRASQAASETLEHVRQTTRSRWVRSRCLATQRSIESGTLLIVALKHGRIIRSREQAWLDCAQKNGTLSEAMERLSDDIKRRQSRRWRIRMSWVVPVCTVLVAAFVLVHAFYLFSFLSYLFGTLP